MRLGQIELIVLSLFTASYTLFSLYGEYTKVGQVSESIAAVAVPTILMISDGATALIYRALTLQLASVLTPKIYCSSNLEKPTIGV